MSPVTTLNTSPAAGEFRRRFACGPLVRAVRTVDVLEHSLPSRLVLAGAATPIGSRVTLIHRMLVVSFDGDGGDRRTLVWEPQIAESVAATPMHALGVMRAPLALASRSNPVRQLCPLERAIERCGIQPAHVDFVASGDLRGHDLRRLAGTVRPLADEHQPRVGVFAHASLLVQGPELETAGAPHPLQAPWYVPKAAEDLLADRVTVLDGDHELGGGVALIATPGLSAGHQSLALNTPGGIWIVSGNGVASDCWQPLLSKMPGVRRSAESERREAMLAAGTVHDSLALYDSLARERSLADASPEDPRWLTILPDRELAPRRLQWPAVPTFSHGGLSFGRM
jgi:hypothetical protein